jgi:hypothetical protein
MNWHHLAQALFALACIIGICALLETADEAADPIFDTDLVWGDC